MNRRNTLCDPSEINEISLASARRSLACRACGLHNLTLVAFPPPAAATISDQPFDWTPVEQRESASDQTAWPVK